MLLSEVTRALLFAYLGYAFVVQRTGLDIERIEGFRLPIFVMIFRAMVDFSVLLFGQTVSASLGNHLLSIPGRSDLPFRTAGNAIAKTERLHSVTKEEGLLADRELY